MCITHTHTITIMAKSTSSTPAASAAGSSSTAVASTPKGIDTVVAKTASVVKVPKSASPAPAASTASGAAAVSKPKQAKQPKESVAPAAAVGGAVAAPDISASAAPAAAAADVSMFAASHTKLQTLVSALASLRSELRGIERQVERELRAARKATDKKRRKNVNRQPSGFVKPTLISNELAAFLGKANGSEMARTEVTREINAYIRDKSLQNKVNGRHIEPDAKLKKLLKLKDDDQLTYFNLQRFMSPHFSTAAKVAAAATASAVSAK
jgi:chromatin remodeling complex protein RSC6